MTDSAHRANVIAAEATRQTALAVAKAAYDGSPASYPAYAASVRASDLGYLRSLVASAEANGLNGPRATIHDLTGLWS
jgi:hypothetical protein